MSHARTARPALRRTRRRPARIAVVRPRPRSVRRVLLAMLGAPLAHPSHRRRGRRGGAVASAELDVQVIRKPTEMFFPVGQALVKSPAETWREYGPLFREHSTAVISRRAARRARPGRGRGQPRGADALELALEPQPLRVVPARLERGRHVPDHRRHLPRREALLHPRPRRRRERAVVRLALVLVQRAVHARGAERRDRDDLGSPPSQRRRRARAPEDRPATLAQKQDLAAVIHLCGAGAGRRLRARAASARPQASAAATTTSRAYLAQVNAMKRQFARLGREPS